MNKNIVHRQKMEYQMKLHNYIKIFRDTIRMASQDIYCNEVFVEKDYWIVLMLNRLGKSKYSADTVFKGSPSLAKEFGLINLFSEDVVIAIIDEIKLSARYI